MTTDEFIEAVNAIYDSEGLLAEVSERTGSIVLKTGPVFVAEIRKNSINWCFNNALIPFKILKLMVELADSRKEDNKYVILNGKPFLSDGSISTRAFLIIDGSLSPSIVSIDDLDGFAYTKEELELMKAALPKNLQAVVYLLTVTVSEAKKVLKHDDME